MSIELFETPHLCRTGDIDRLTKQFLNAVS